MKKFLTLVILMGISVPCFGATLQQAQKYYYQGKFIEAFDEANAVRFQDEPDNVNTQANIICQALGTPRFLIWASKETPEQLNEQYKELKQNSQQYVEEHIQGPLYSDDLSDTDKNTYMKYALGAYKFLAKYGYFSDKRIYDIATAFIIDSTSYTTSEKQFNNIYYEVLPIVQKYGNGRYYTEHVFTADCQVNMRYMWGQYAKIEKR